MSAGTRAAAQEAPLQQRLAGRGGDGEDDGDDGTPELGSWRAKTPKTTDTYEKRTVYVALTNAEPEVPERYNRILVNIPKGLAVGITAGVDQTGINAVRA